jgi:LacI family transcriptional regulator
MISSRAPIKIQDVASAAGVSVSTVSRVLNDKDDVAPATYEKVKRVINELGYTSSLAAKSMRSRKTNVIGLIVIDLSDPFSIELVKGVGRAVRESGYDLIAISSGHSASTTASAWEREHITRLNGSITDGIIVATPTTTNLPSTFPLVVIDPYLEDGQFPAVISTNRQGALSVMEYLINLGHHHIGFVGGRPNLQSATRRLQGYKDGLRQADLPICSDLIQNGDFTQQTGYSCAQKLLELPEPPTAIFAANDKSAIGVIEAANNAGLKIPEDLSVIGFDNILEAPYINGGLTTVDQSIEEMGRLGVDMLMKLIENRPLEDPLYRMPTELIIRNTCRVIEART